MVIIQHEGMRALRALNAIQGRKELTTTRTGKNLFDLKRALRPVYDFQCEREQEITERLGGIIDQMTGVITFPGCDEDTEKAKRAELSREFGELAMIETEVDVKPFTVPESEELHVNMDEQEALEKFITFQ